MNIKIPQEEYNNLIKENIKLKSYLDEIIHTHVDSRPVALEKYEMLMGKCIIRIRGILYPEKKE